MSRPGHSACFHATLNISHARVSPAFPVCYAVGNVAGGMDRDVSWMCRDVRGFSPFAALGGTWPPLERWRHMAVTLPKAAGGRPAGPTYARGSTRGPEPGGAYRITPRTRGM